MKNVKYAVIAFHAVVQKFDVQTQNKIKKQVFFLLFTN